MGTVTLLRSARTVAEASGRGLIDWDAVAEATKASTPAGSLDLTEEERSGYAADVRDARRRVRSVSGIGFEVPDTVEIQNRHHWIDANIDTFRRVIQPIEEHATRGVPAFARVLNTGSMSVMLGFLARHVLGQYDPLLLADAPQEDHGLYFVHPNVRRASEDMEVSYPRFRRWIAFHEVTHAAEFGAAPWLSAHLEERMERGIAALADGTVDREAFAELQTAMTVVEGYAELLMDEAFDDEYDDLRAALDERRQSSDPLSWLLRRALGLGMKRRQYERGRTFFDAVVTARGLDAAGTVWDRPENLPDENELDNPSRWLRRVDP